MKQGDEIIYTIAISGIRNAVNQRSIVELLPNHVGSAKMIITSGAINIPRLFTFWREDYQEQAWQQVLMEAVKGHGASIAIDVQPWTPAAGYPQGDVEL